MSRPDALGAALVVWLGFAAAAISGEIGLVRSLAASPEFVEVLRYRAPLNMVGANGAVGANRDRYAHAAAQRDVVWLVLRGLVEDDPEALDDAVRALEYGFGKQTAQGNFANALGVSDEMAVGADAFFLQSYCRIQLLIGRSSYAPSFAERFFAMNDRLPVALQWLESNKEELFRQDRHATNRLFFDAVAFVLCGQIVGDRVAIDAGKTFAGFGLKNQRSDGSFDEHGGGDSSYQAVSLLNIAGLLAHLPAGTEAQALRKALQEGAEWQLSRIEPTGRISATGNTRTGVGREDDKQINYYEVALALLYASLLLDDSRFADAARAISTFMLSMRG